MDPCSATVRAEAGARSVDLLASGMQWAVPVDSIDHNLRLEAVVVTLSDRICLRIPPEFTPLDPLLMPGSPINHQHCHDAILFLSSERALCNSSSISVSICGCSPVTATTTTSLCPSSTSSYNSPPLLGLLSFLTATPLKSSLFARKMNHHLYMLLLCGEIKYSKHKQNN